MVGTHFDPRTSLAAALAGVRLSGLSPADLMQAQSGTIPWTLQAQFQQPNVVGFKPMGAKSATPVMQRTPGAGIRLSGLSPLEYAAAVGGNMPQGGARMSSPDYGRALAAVQASTPNMPPSQPMASTYSTSPAVSPGSNLSMFASNPQTLGTPPELTQYWSPMQHQSPFGPRA